MQVNAHATRISVHPVALGASTDGILTPFNTLGCLVAYAKVHDGGALAKCFAFGRITPFANEAPALLDEIAKGPPSIVLLSSYVWNHDANIRFARAVRDRSPQSLIAIGGPHIPRLPGEDAAFLRRHPEIDFTARNEGELTLAEILETIAAKGDPACLRSTDFSAVTGVTFRPPGEDPVRNADRQRTRDLGIFPSPFLTGEFDHWMDGAPLMPIETNRGCPYGCTFCDWGASTLSKVHRMTDERVFGEIEYAARKHVRFLGFCDANFGILPRDVDIAEHLIRTNQATGWPKETGFTSAKVATDRLLQIAKMLHRAGLLTVMQSALQTTDPKVLSIVKRDNIKISEYEKMISFYRKEGIPVGADLMVGIPGQTFESCAKDLQFVFDRALTAVLYATSVMPNAPMAAEGYRQQYEIQMDDEGFVESTFSFDNQEYLRIFQLCLAYKFLVKVGVARYLIYFMQRERGVKALDFVKRWMAARENTRYPLSQRVWSELILGRNYNAGLKHWLVLHWSEEASSFLFDDMEAFLGEIVRFYKDELGADVEGTDVNAVVKAQQAVMPCHGRETIRSVALDHDVPAYFTAMRDCPNIATEPQEFTPLRCYGPGHIELLNAKPHSYAFADLNTLIAPFEIESNLSL